MVLTEIGAVLLSAGLLAGPATGAALDDATRSPEVCLLRSSCAGEPLFCLADASGRNAARCAPPADVPVCLTDECSGAPALDWRRDPG